MEGVNTDLQVH